MIHPRHSSSKLVGGRCVHTSPQLWFPCMHSCMHACVRSRHAGDTPKPLGPPYESSPPLTSRCSRNTERGLHVVYPVAMCGPGYRSCQCHKMIQLDNTRLTVASQWYRGHITGLPHLLRFATALHTAPCRLQLSPAPPVKPPRHTSADS